MMFLFHSVGQKSLPSSEPNLASRDAARVGTQPPGSTPNAFTETAAKTGMEALAQAKATFDAILATSKAQFSETGKFSSERLMNDGLKLYRECAITEADIQTKLIGKPSETERKQLVADLETVKKYRAELTGDALLRVDGVCPPQMRSLFDFADKVFQVKPNFAKARVYLAIYEGRPQIVGGFQGTFAKGVLELYQKTLDANKTKLNEIDKDAYDDQSKSLAKIFSLLPKAQSPAIAEKKPEKAAEPAKAELTHEQKKEALKKYLRDSKPGTSAFIKGASSAERDGKTVVLFDGNGKKQAAFHYDGKDLRLDGKSSLDSKDLVRLAYDAIFNPDVLCWGAVDAKLKEGKAQTFENGKYKVAITINEKNEALAELFEGKKKLGDAALSTAGAEKGSGITNAHLAYLMGLTISKAEAQAKKEELPAGLRELQTLVGTYRGYIKTAKDAIAANAQISPENLKNIIGASGEIYAEIAFDYTKASQAEQELRNSAKNAFNEVFPKFELREPKKGEEASGAKSFYNFARAVYNDAPGAALKPVDARSLLIDIQVSPPEFSPDLQKAIARGVFEKYQSMLDGTKPDSNFVLVNAQEAPECRNILGQELDKLKKAPIEKKKVQPPVDKPEPGKKEEKQPEPGKKEEKQPEPGKKEEKQQPISQPIAAQLSKVTTAPISDAAWAAAKEIFDNYVLNAVRPDKTAREKLKAALSDDAKYDNFMAIFSGGEVEIPGNKWQFFTGRFKTFKTIAIMVNNAAQKADLQSDGKIFQFSSKTNAGIFRKAISQMGCISMTASDRQEIADKERELVPLNQDLVAFAFTYKAPPAISELEKPRGTLAKTKQNAESQSHTYKAKYDEEAVIPRNELDYRLEPEKLSNSSAEFDVSYITSRELIYNRHFTKQDRASTSMLAAKISENHLPRFLDEENVSLNSQGKYVDSSGKVLAVDERLKLVEKLMSTGYASLEVVSQLKENDGLALERARITARPVIERLFGNELPKVEGRKGSRKYNDSFDAREAKINGYMKGLKLVPKVVSIWSTPELVAYGISKAESARNLKKFSSSLDQEGQNDEDSHLMNGNLSNGDLYKAIVSMKDKAGYDAACGMVKRSGLNKPDKAALLSYIEKAYGEAKKAGTPAFSCDGKTKELSIVNQEFAQKFFYSQESGGISLRFEENREENGKLKHYAPTTAMEKLGAHFAWALEQGYSRSASLTRKSKGVLDIRLEEKPTLVVPGQQYTAKVSVGYRIGDEKKDFTGGTLRFYVGTGETAQVAEKDVVLVRQRTGVGEDQRYEYNVTFTAPSAEKLKSGFKSDREISAAAYKEVSAGKTAYSDHVWAPLRMMPTVEDRHIKPEKVVIPEVKPASMYYDKPFVSPVYNMLTKGNFGVFATGLFGSTGPTGLNQRMIGALENGRYGQFANGVITIRPDLTLNEVVKLNANIADAFNGWFQSKFPDSNLNSITVAQYMLDNKILMDNVTIDQLLNTLRTLGLEEASKLFNDTGFGTAFKTFGNNLKAFKSALQFQQALDQLKRGGVTFEAQVQKNILAAKKKGDLSIDLYACYDFRSNQVRILDLKELNKTDTQAALHNGSMDVVFRLDNIRFSAGAGASGFVSKIEGFESKWQPYVNISGSYGVRIDDYVSMQADVLWTRLFGQAGKRIETVRLTTPISDVINLQLGASVDASSITNGLSGNVRIGTIAPVKEHTPVLEGAYIGVGASYEYSSISVNADIMKSFSSRDITPRFGVKFRF